MIASTPPTFEWSSEHRLAALDGLRTIAVLLVLFEHTMPNPPFLPLVGPPGGTGVRLFFVLSGYLLTGILLRARDTTEDRRGIWAAFAARRSLRIFPLAYVTILTAWLLDLPFARAQIIPLATYTYNWLPPAEAIGNLAHFWSLSVEEQFYIGWPLLILWVPRARVRTAIVLVVIGAGLWRGIVAAEPGSNAYFSTLTRLDSLAWGGLLACTPSWRITAGLGLACALAALAGVWPAVFFEWGAIGISGGVILAARQRHVSRVLSLPPLVALGTISYGIYVLHGLIIPTVELLEARWDVWLRVPLAQGLGQLAAVTALSVLGASVSWLVMERPINGLKRYFPYVRARRSIPTGRDRRTDDESAPGGSGQS